MKRHVGTAILYTIVTTALLGLVYPLIVTGLAQLLFRDEANGQIIVRDGKAIGSRIIGQPFTGETYFHSRPSAAGDGYDGASSGASNLAPTSKTLIDAIAKRVIAEQIASRPVPIELVTASASGLDPHISPAAALYQIPRVAHARGMSEQELTQLVTKLTEGRQLGALGEPRINVLALNLELDTIHPKSK